MNYELGPAFARSRPFFSLGLVGEQQACAQSHYAEDFAEVLTACLRGNGPHEWHVTFTLRCEDCSPARNFHALPNGKAVGKREEVQLFDIREYALAGIEGNDIVPCLDAEPQVLWGQVVEQASPKDAVSQDIGRQPDDKALPGPDAFDNSGSRGKIVNMFVKVEASPASGARADLQQLPPGGQHKPAKPGGCNRDINPHHRRQFFRSRCAHRRIPGVREGKVQAVGKAILKPLYFGFRLRHGGYPLSLGCIYYSAIPYIFAEVAKPARAKVVQGCRYLVTGDCGLAAWNAQTSRNANEFPSPVCGVKRTLQNVSARKLSNPTGTNLNLSGNTHQNASPGNDFVTRILIFHNIGAPWKC